jgi:hypothetical protein
MYVQKSNSGPIERKGGLESSKTKKRSKVTSF